MNLLLDSHVAVWWAENPALLDAAARDAIGNPANSVWASAASVWELAIKVAAGKLALDVGSLFRGLTGQGVRLLGIGMEAALEAGALRWDHRDPFDRMLVAQARLGGLTLLSRDQRILDYDGIPTHPA